MGKPSLIIILGGPGSQKGTLMQELAQEFDFVTISVEDIVFTYLPSKVANTVKNTVEMQELLKVSFIYVKRKIFYLKKWYIRK